MALIVLGLLLWTWPHMWKELTPGLRARLPDGAAKGIVALTSLGAIVLMVIGYRGAEIVPLYTPPSWGMHLNNLLMFIAVGMFGVGNSKSRLRGAIRHPMFTGTILWGIAHLLVNGDLASVVLFGGMILWAVLGWIVTNARVHDFVPYAGGSLKGDIRLAIITLVVFVVIVIIHTWLGYRPIPG